MGLFRYSLGVQPPNPGRRASPPDPRCLLRPRTPGASLLPDPGGFFALGSLGVSSPRIPGALGGGSPRLGASLPRLGACCSPSGALRSVCLPHADRHRSDETLSAKPLRTYTSHEQPSRGGTQVQACGRGDTQEGQTPRGRARALCAGGGISGERKRRLSGVDGGELGGVANWWVRVREGFGIEGWGCLGGVSRVRTVGGRASWFVSGFLC
jgi:hypothetical protein